MKYLRIILLSLLVPFGFFNHSILGSGSFLWAEIAKEQERYYRVNKVLANKHVLPRYKVFANETAKIERTAKKFCVAQSSVALTDLRKVFHSAADAWIRVEHIKFGPIEENLRFHRINFWPDIHNTGSKHLGRILKSKDRTMLEPQKFSLKSVALQGFPALERLLFIQSDELFKGDDLANFRCNLIQAISRNLREIANSVLFEWIEENNVYINENTYKKNPLSYEEKEIFQDYFVSLYGILRTIHDIKLRRPLGETPETSRPKKSEAWRSERSMRNIIINLESAQQLFQGEWHFGMGDFIQIMNPETRVVKDFNITLKYALKTAREIPIPLHKAVLDSKWHDKIDQLKAQILSMMDIVRGRIFSSLGMGTGFNFLDGDGI